ncbi:XRE family transcriptional regulator [Hyphococcus luteus]|uniref:XRE family transcriptional regulator n=1 Tax=Hyphococcus luteus TaxID=2058213 RepID=UPI001A9C2EC9|nr:XRE family transcriptional regulator [Marinicaulis flavus]
MGEELQKPVKERKAADLNQTELAKALAQYQSFVARVESGERRVDVIEFPDIANANAIGFDPKAAIKKICRQMTVGPIA